jgi:hypothetical protein
MKKLVVTASVLAFCGGIANQAPPSDACANSPIADMEPQSVAAEGQNTDVTCASVVKTLPWKKGAPGDACTGPLDCAPTCCACPSTSPNHALASWCDHQTCATTEATCCMVLGTSLKACGG